MNYIGSKHTLRPFLEQVYRNIANGTEKVLCDIFAGTGAVGRHFKHLGLQIIANDLQYYAYVLNKAYIEINEPPLFTGLREKYAREIQKHRSRFEEPVQEVLSFINDLPGVSGFITQNYCPDSNRFYYTKENAQKADAIRQAIEQWKCENLITEQEYFYILCSLLEAVDQVANTASVYGAFLKDYKKSAKKQLYLKPLEIINHVTGCKVFNKDANELIKSIECDILYLDPPY
ncbi:MAG: DNA adenine methylase, partial [Blastocatellia bacterium]|nr:DNA adenine methylase [Blastocatellia bacterium]